MFPIEYSGLEMSKGSKVHSKSGSMVNTKP
jgi:hypothetical protein